MRPTHSLTIPHGSDTISVELTVKEAMALANNIHFDADPGVQASAKRKIARTLERKLLPDAAKIDYQMLEL